MIGTDRQLILSLLMPLLLFRARHQNLTKNMCYMLEISAHNNLPLGVAVNHRYVSPKAGRVLVILINTTSRNIWIGQPLLAANIYEIELHPWQLCASLT